MLTGLVGPGRGWVALEVVVPGLAGCVYEVQPLEGEGAVEPGLLGRVLDDDGLFRRLECLRNVCRLVGLRRPREVGRGEVAQQARVLGGLGRSRLEGLDRAAHVSRNQVRDAQGSQGLRRGIALCALADAGDGGEDGRRLGVEALRGLARAQGDEAAVVEAPGQPRLDEPPSAHRLDQLRHERRCAMGRRAIQSK